MSGVSIGTSGIVVGVLMFVLRKPFVRGRPRHIPRNARAERGLMLVAAMVAAITLPNKDPEPGPPPEAERQPLASRIAPAHRPRGADSDEG